MREFIHKPEGDGASRGSHEQFITRHHGGETIFNVRRVLRENKVDEVQIEVQIEREFDTRSGKRTRTAYGVMVIPADKIEDFVDAVRTIRR